MDNLKNILLPTDFSENAKNAIPYAIDLIKKNNAKLSLLHVYNIPLMAPTDIFTTSDNIMTYSITEDVRKLSSDKLKKIINNNQLSGIKHRCFIREGDVQNKIIKIIKKEAIDVIVMGTKGESTKRDLFMGSITKAIIQHATCPILVIPEKATFNTISKIVYATDLQQDESNMINYLVEFAKMYNANLVILHIDHDENIKKWSIDLLKDIINKSNYPKIDYKEIVLNDVVEGINNYVAEFKPDILSMTTNITTLFDKIFHKSLTKELLLHTHIPLLTFNRKNTMLFF